ncbi:hypothetical protein BN903_19 [Halorubrum sp. AJ67]|nr:hypothetical protein BN903_19 [Halorubrum sp. AJ67]
MGEGRSEGEGQSESEERSTGEERLESEGSDRMDVSCSDGRRRKFPGENGTKYD